MDRQFPLIKSTSVLPFRSSKAVKPAANQKSPPKKNLFTTRLVTISKNPTSSLPPINSSMEIPSISPITSNLYPKQTTSRRTLSHQLFLLDSKSVVKKYYIKTKTGSSKGVPKPQNQDSFIIIPSVLSQKSVSFFAVCDGHGTEGHLVSSMIKSNFISILEKHVSVLSPNEALIRSVSEINDRVLHSKIQTEFSGSTFVGVLIQGENLFCANVGDSAAVLGSLSGGWKMQRLSEEHNPLRRDEAERILENGGRIASHVRGGPLRIWYMDESFPGLAMTRSIGDKVSRNIGLIGDAEIVSKKLGVSDKFVIIASDGLWEFMEYREAVEIVGELVVAGKSELSCLRLLKEATERWTRNSMSVDDITIIVVFLSVN